MPEKIHPRSNGAQSRLDGAHTRPDGAIPCLKVECLLTSAIWSYGHEAEVYIFLNLPFPSNPKENSSIRCILSTPEQDLL